MVSKRVRRTPTANSTPPVRIASLGAAITAVTGTNNSPPGSGGTPRNTRGVPDDLLVLTKEQLKVECRKRGQKTTGTKTELLQRLGHKMSTKRSNATVTSSSTSSTVAAAAGAATTNGSAMQQQSSQSKQSSLGDGGGGSSTHHHHHHHHHHSGSSRHQQKVREREEREGIVLWRHPITTIQYALKESFILLNTYGQSLFRYKLTVLSVISTVLLILFLRNIAGPHQAILQLVYKQIMWCSYWIGLGILSSVGLGTGLHTFLLYLGPHIAQVTLAAYECGSLNFPEPPYPDEIICPNETANPMLITIFAIMSKVRLESMCWGAGTALGELPPYFMARAARLSGMDPDDDDDDLAQIEQLQKKKKEELTLVERGKLFVEHIVQKVGFFGILACASIPNPLFDLAGITCGHFLVPFWTFFGATLIGKAIIKMHIQKLFVIVAFNETLINSALDLMRTVPIIGGRLVDPFRSFLDGQKERLHSGSVPDGTKSGAGRLMGAIFEKFVVAMICYFLVSIVNSAAQSYHKRITRKKGSTKHAKD